MTKLGYRFKTERQLKYSKTIDSKTIKASGRLDLVIRKQHLIYAIELDNISPRKKSIEKINSFGNGFVVLRNCHKPKV